MDNADEEEDADGASRKKNRRLSGHNAGEESGGMTRVDLINRALAIMKRLQQENTELKQSLARSNGRDKNEVRSALACLGILGGKCFASDSRLSCCRSWSWFRLLLQRMTMFHPQRQLRVLFDHRICHQGSLHSQHMNILSPCTWVANLDTHRLPNRRYGDLFREQRSESLRLKGSAQMDLHDGRANPIENLILH